jgi:DHA1 family bicyclomycin/chloramphenicol resistance-like MFS transporter
MNQAAAQNETRQKVLGSKGLLLYLVLLSAFVPLSTDLYLPALPAMTKYFNAPGVLTNLTIILFFLFYSVAS